MKASRFPLLFVAVAFFRLNSIPALASEFPPIKAGPCEQALLPEGYQVYQPPLLHLTYSPKAIPIITQALEMSFGQAARSLTSALAPLLNEIGNISFQLKQPLSEVYVPVRIEKRAYMVRLSYAIAPDTPHPEAHYQVQNLKLFEDTQWPSTGPNRAFQSFIREEASQRGIERYTDQVEQKLREYLADQAPFPVLYWELNRNNGIYWKLGKGKNVLVVFNDTFDGERNRRTVSRILKRFDFRIQPHVVTKLMTKHQLSLFELSEAFENWNGMAVQEEENEHPITHPLLLPLPHLSRCFWFLSKTNEGRPVRVVIYLNPNMSLPEIVTAYTPSTAKAAHEWIRKFDSSPNQKKIR